MLTIEPNSTTTAQGTQPSVRNTPFEYEVTSLESMFEYSYSGKLILASKTTSVNIAPALPVNPDSKGSFEDLLGN